MNALSENNRAATVLNKTSLFQIGQILALDVLVFSKYCLNFFPIYHWVYFLKINNCDRLPLIWTHQGNAGNLMFDEDNNAVSIGLLNQFIMSIFTLINIYVDGQIVGLPDSASRQDYQRRVESLLQSLKTPGKCSFFLRYSC